MEESRRSRIIALPDSADLLQVGLAIFCLVDLARRDKTRGPKWMWAIIILFGELVGPWFLVIGKGNRGMAAIKRKG